jgi:pullulanase/glycogen debranching enzyme
MTTWSETEGSPQPPGATWLEEEKSYNCSLYSRHATGVTLLLYTAGALVNPVAKHNLANGQSNSDGTDTNLSWNCGWEGDQNVPAKVMQLRKQQIKNFFTILMVSNGTPMFCAGDEFMNTQHVTA